VLTSGTADQTVCALEQQSPVQFMFQQVAQTLAVLSKFYQQD
jgi:hypothetical protein